jgi:serine/threonine protein kinase/tetratricopeptide (TPR) repeat protein
LAHDRYLNQRVAIKQLFSYASDTPEKMRSVCREIEAGRRITHRNVLKIFDICDLNRSKCISMEYVTGKSLSEWFRDASASPDELKSIVFQLCSGVAAIHEAGFAHRDLRPGNIMLDQTGRVVIADLGLAGLAHTVAERSETSVAALYDPPERLIKPDPIREDIYAIGGIILFLLGIRTAEGATPGDALYGADFSQCEWLRSIVSRCREFDASARFKNGSDLFNEVLRTIPTEDSERRDRVSNRRSSRALSSVLLVALCFVLNSVGFSHRGQASSASERILLVVPSTASASDRWISDIVTCFLETQHITVLQTPDWINNPDQYTPEARLSLSFSRPDAPEIHVRIVTNSAPLSRDFIGNRGDPLFAAVSWLASLLSIQQPMSSFALPTYNQQDLERSASMWHSGLVGAQPLPVQDHNIPVLLLNAQFDVDQFRATRLPSWRDEATHLITILQGLGIDTTETRLIRATLARVNNNPTEGVRILHEALESLSTKAPIYERLASDAIEAGFAEEGLSMATKALECDKYSPRCYRSLARAYSAMWRDKEAVGYLQRAIEIGDDSPATMGKLGAAYIRLGQFEPARQILSRAVERGPNPEVEVFLGLADLLDNRTTQGLLILRGAAAAKPSLYSVSTLAAALRWTGNDNEAQKYFREAIALGNLQSKDPRELGRLALLFAQLGNIRRADDYIRRAAAIDRTTNAELLYDGLIIDAFASRTPQCREKWKLLEQSHFPMAFLSLDPRVKAEMKKR